MPQWWLAEVPQKLECSVCGETLKQEHFSGKSLKAYAEQKHFSGKSQKDLTCKRCVKEEVAARETRDQQKGQTNPMKCSECGICLPKSTFSSRQRHKKASNRKCPECAEISRAQKNQEYREKAESWWRDLFAPRSAL